MKYNIKENSELLSFMKSNRMYKFSTNKPFLSVESVEFDEEIKNIKFKFIANFFNVSVEDFHYNGLESIFFIGNLKEVKTLFKKYGFSGTFEDISEKVINGIYKDELLEKLISKEGEDGYLSTHIKLFRFCNLSKDKVLDKMLDFGKESLTNEDYKILDDDLVIELPEIH